MVLLLGVVILLINTFMTHGAMLGRGFGLGFGVGCAAEPFLGILRFGVNTM